MWGSTSALKLIWLANGCGVALCTHAWQASLGEVNVQEIIPESSEEYGAENCALTTCLINVPERMTPHQKHWVPGALLIPSFTLLT